MRTAILMLLLISEVVLAAEVLVPPRVENPPVIDGILNEEIWQHALVVSDFLQRLPKEGGLPSEKTEMRILYTRTALYLGFRAYDSHPKGIVATVRKRDDFDITQNDQFAVAIDSYNDGRNGFWFSTNPVGARVDAQFADEGDQWELNWNGIWSCKTSIDEHGWSAEIEIPFSTLRFRKAATNIMGINFYRRLIRTNEQLFAPLIPLSLSNGTPNVSVARKYQFSGITAGHSIYLKPYGLTGFSNSSGNRSQTNGGADLRYQLTSSLTSNLSMRMDFAEADVDDRQINLTRFRLFFPEKREFFLENASNFAFGNPGESEIFFSRRIGINDESGETVPINAGGKLTGKLGMFDVGILDVQTGATDSSPAENFGVFRIKAGIRQRSYLGAIFTTRDSNARGFSDAYGPDLNLHISHDVFLNGFAVRTGDQSNAYSLALLRQGERASFRLAYSDIDRNFDPPIGFLQRIDSRRWDANLFIPIYVEQELILSWTPGYEFVSDRDHEGRQTDLFHQFSLRTNFQSGDQVRLFINQEKNYLSVPLPIFRSIDIPTGSYTANRGGLEIATKDGRRLSGNILASGGGFYGGTRYEITPSLLWKVNSHLTVSQSLSENFIRLPEDHFRILLVRSRFSYALNTSFSLSSVLQYDNSSQSFGMNFRASYLFREGTELIIVYNGSVNKNPLLQDEANSNAHSLLVKFTYLLQF